MRPKLNIALVSAYDYALPSGVTNHIDNLAAQLKSKGHAITIFAPCSSNNITDQHFVPISKAIAIPTNGSIARISLSLSSFSKAWKTELATISLPNSSLPTNFPVNKV